MSVTVKPRTCPPPCGRVLVKRTHESAATFRGRTYCSKHCLGVALRKRAEPKPCEGCRTPMSPTGRMEHYNNFVARRFCSKSCARRAEQGG